MTAVAAIGYRGTAMSLAQGSNEAARVHGLAPPIHRTVTVCR